MYVNVKRVKNYQKCRCPTAYGQRKIYATLNIKQKLNDKKCIFIKMLLIISLRFFFFFFLMPIDENAVFYSVYL